MRVVLCNQYVLSVSGWEAALSKTNGRAAELPLSPLLDSCLRENGLPPCEWLSTIWSDSPLVSLPFAPSTLTYPSHAHTLSSSAQRNSISNFPWLRKQYTRLNNVDISNALKCTSNGALIGRKWIHGYIHRVPFTWLYHSDLLWNKWTVARSPNTQVNVW